MPIEIECPYCKNKLKAEIEQRIVVAAVEAPKVEPPAEAATPAAPAV